MHRINVSEGLGQEPSGPGDAVTGAIVIGCHVMRLEKMGVQRPIGPSAQETREAILIKIRIKFFHRLEDFFHRISREWGKAGFLLGHDERGLSQRLHRDETDWHEYLPPAMRA